MTGHSDPTSLDIGTGRTDTPPLYTAIPTPQRPSSHTITSTVSDLAPIFGAESNLPEQHQHQIHSQAVPVPLIPAELLVSQKDRSSSPIPQTALRTSMSLHRPPFVHASTEYETQTQNQHQRPTLTLTPTSGVNTPATASGSRSRTQSPHLNVDNTHTIHSHSRDGNHPLSSSRRSSIDIPHSGELHHLHHHHHHHEQHAPGLSSGSGSSSSSSPYRDYPPSKEDVLESPYNQSHSHAQLQSQSRTAQHGHGRGIYTHRRSPSFLDNAVATSRSVSAEWKNKLLGGKEAGIGRWLMIGWVMTTVGFLLATAFWKGELFSALDSLSKQLFALGFQGQLIFGFLIFITTIPPLPLYSTLMVLSGYTFGVWNGFVVSYIASLSGAIIVFIVSRTLLRDVLTKCLAGSPTANSLLQIIPANPHLLLLIRVAPYPYNLLNVILASSPCLTLRTYTACTALSLCKLVLHTWIGAGLHDLSELHGHPSPGEPGPDDEGNPGTFPPGHRRPHRPHGRPPYPRPHWSPEDQARQDMKYYSTWFGVFLCIALFFYLTHLAKRALAKAQAEQEAREARGEGMRSGGVYLREEA